MSNDQFKPRFGWAKGMMKEEHAKLVEAGKKALGIKPHEESDFERIMIKARERVKVVSIYADMVLKEHADAGKDVDRKIFAQEVHRKYLECFRDADKDELLIILTFFLTQQTVQTKI